MRSLPHPFRLLPALLVILFAASALHAQEKVPSDKKGKVIRKNRDDEKKVKPKKAEERREGKKDMEENAPTSTSTIGKGFEEHVEGRTEWFMARRRYPYDMVPSGLRAAAVRQTAAMERRMADLRMKGDKGALILAANRWEPIGPVNIAGRIPAIAQHPTEQGTIYVGAASGGVWKTTNDGVSWTTSFDKQSSLTVGALAIDPVDTRIIYAGTGECYGHTEEYFGDGMFKSTDGGESWQNIGLQNVGGFAEIHVDRGNHLLVYAAATKENGGLYRSEDGGKSWSRIFTMGVYDMAVDPTDGKKIYVATGSSVHRTTDGGDSFTNVTTGIGASASVRISIAMAPSDPNRIYALLARNAQPGNPNIADFYSSTNGGQSWQFRQSLGDNFFREQGFYNNCLAVHPDSPDVVLAGGIDVFRSENGGRNFFNITQSYYRWTEPNVVHPDQHILQFDPKNHNRVLLGNDGGLYVSENAGLDWSRKSVDLPITQFYKFDVDQTNINRVYGGTQDNGTVGAIGASLLNWKMVSGGDGFFVVVDPIDPSYIFTEVYYGRPTYRINIFNPDNPIIIDNAIPETGDWSTPLVASNVDGRLYSGRRNLWRTSNNGATWQQLTTGTRGVITAVGLSASFSEPGRMAVGSAGEIRYSSDDGNTWRTSTGIPNRVVSDIKFDATDPLRVYATLSGSGNGHVFRSTNGGASFTNISGNLPDAPVNCITIDPANSSHLFVGTDAGCFVSLDGGKLWMPFNEGLPFAPVVDLKVHEATRMLVAATHGRSMFKISIASIEEQPVLITPAGGASYQSPGSLTSIWSGLTGPLRVAISYDGGQNYETVAENIVADSLEIALPLVKTTVARVKVEEMAGDGDVVISDHFSLLPKANGSEQNGRGFPAEAIEYRRGHLWATVRGTDSIYKLRLPTLSGSRVGLVRVDIPGHARDLAYDEVNDRFYVLVAEDDFSEPRLYRMDTNGVGGGEVPLPDDLERASGVAMTAEGIAIVTPGTSGELFLLNDDGSLIRRSGPMVGAANEERRALCWDGAGFLQGVLVNDPSAWFRSQLDRVRLSDSARVDQKIPVILQRVERLAFVGLAVDKSNPDLLTYWATDTAGAFYKFAQLFSGVEGGTMPDVRRASELALREVAPNPFRAETKVVVAAKNRRDITLELYRESGERAMLLYEGSVEMGETTLTLQADGLASGVYYLVLSGDGERDVRPVIMVK